MNQEREARVIYHHRRAVAELGLAHALIDSRQVQQTSERDLSELDDCCIFGGRDRRRDGLTVATAAVPGG